MIPPNGLGRGAGAMGALGERDGVDGDAGLVGAGRAGGEYEREPRLPPLPARAHASLLAAASVPSVSNTIRMRDVVVFRMPCPLMV
jgi:hypothetical protein